MQSLRKFTKWTATSYQFTSLTVTSRSYHKNINWFCVFIHTIQTMFSVSYESVHSVFKPRVMIVFRLSASDSWETDNGHKRIENDFFARWKKKKQRQSQINRRIEY